ncbi:MAG: sensor histidine kinase, partial [Ignavibacterium sp.]
MRLKIKLALFNLITKLAVTGLFVLILPYLTQRINLRQIDNSLVEKREKIISLIEEYGIEPFIEADSADAFGSYNILKEEYVSLERTEFNEEINLIEVSERLIENDIISYRVHKYSLLIDGKEYIIEIGKSLESILQTEKNIKKVILIFILFIIFITFITDFRYTQSLLKPLDRIMVKLKEISSPATFDRKPISTNTDDFRQLDKTLIELMNKLNDLFAKEKEISINISHELMTPVSVLRSKLENLLLKESLDYETEEKIEESLKTLQRLQMLIKSLLMIARIESQQFLKNEKVTINEILKEVIDELTLMADDKKIQIVQNLNDNIELQKANRSLLFSMFYNVINNSIKNTPEEGLVEI